MWSGLHRGVLNRTARLMRAATAALLQQHIRRLDIPMHQAVLVQVSAASGHVTRNTQPPASRGNVRSLGVQPMVERGLAVLEHDACARGREGGAEQRDNVGVGERGVDEKLMLESCELRRARACTAHRHTHTHTVRHTRRCERRSHAST